MQDAASLVVSGFAGGRSERQTFAMALVLAAGFPLGAAFAAGVTAGDGPVMLAYVRVAVGGVFVYMALFELAPPHAHGRCASLRLLLCFVAGLAAAYFSEAVEQLMAGTNGESAAHAAKHMELHGGGPLGGGPLGGGPLPSAVLPEPPHVAVAPSSHMMRLSQVRDCNRRDCNRCD